jgi:hypothetical protein
VYGAEVFTISDRPAEADDRAVPGHWEGDLIMGEGNQSAIGTLVERATRFTILLHLPTDHTAESVATAMIEAMAELPDHLRRSITWDRGSEMANWQDIQLNLNAPVFFCNPHSPWQRGTNENTYWCTVLMPERFDGSRPAGCWVTRKTRAADGFPLICPRQPRARALTGSDLIEAC